MSSTSDLLIGAQQSCQSLADAIEDNGDHQDIMDAVRNALDALVQLYAYGGRINTLKDYDAVRRILNLTP